MLASIAMLVGCQGVSAGNSSQPPNGDLSFATMALNFGSVAAGSSKTMTVSATNSGTKAVTVNSAAMSSKYFSLAAPSLPVVVGPGQSATLSVKFTPNSAGTFSGTVSVSSDAANAVPSLSVSGTGLSDGQLALNPSSEDFASVTVGSKRSQTVTLTNTGQTSVNISQASISGTGYQLSGITTPLMLDASQSTTLTVSFAPQSTGSSDGSLAITSDGANPTLTMALTGTGIPVGALGSNPTSLSFGSVTTGNNKTLAESVTNTGSSSITISQAAISGAGFSLSGIAAPLTLSAGQSANFSVSFAPKSSGSVSGSVTLTSSASNPTLTIPLSGTGVAPGALASNPTSISFGSVQVGSNQTLSETVTNTGGSSVAISQVGISGTGFSLSGIAAPLTLTAGQSASFTVSFAPKSAGSVSGSVTLTSSATNPTLTIPLAGTGTAASAQLTVSPGTLAVGSVVVGSSRAATGSLTANGASVTVTAATTNNSVFSIGGLPLPVTIPAGQSASFTITFSPKTSGAVSSTLTVTSSAQPSTSTETLTGTGTPAPSHSVNLSWNASTSPNISGYNIYRALYTTSCGSYGKINSVLNTGTLYTDSTVVDGTGYCYATTAVDTSNQESGYSNIVSNVQIPSP